MEFETLHNRQKDFAWFKSQDILIIGAGGIGGFTALSLSRINHTLFIYDMDVVEPHNIAAGQFFTINDIGQSKVKALRDNIIKFGGNQRINAFLRYNKDSIVMPFTILALDNMETRKLAVLKWRAAYLESNNANKFPILIDGRLEGEQGIIYTLRTIADADRWLDEWFPDTEIEGGSCTMRATSYNAMMIGANITAIFNNHIANMVNGDNIRVIPYKLEYGFPGLVYDVIL